MALSSRRTGTACVAGFRLSASSRCPNISTVLKLVDVVEVRPLGGHRLFLRFEDGLEGEIDFSTMSWHGVFAPLEDPAYFARVWVDAEAGTITWPGEVDIAPETLYHWISERFTHVPA